MSLDSSVTETPKQEDIVIAHKLSDVSIAVSESSSTNNERGNFQLSSDTIRLTKTDEAGSIEMSEPEQRYIEEMSLQAQGELFENQIKPKKDTDEISSIVIKEPELRHIDVSLQAQGELFKNQIKLKNYTDESSSIIMKESELRNIDVSLEPQGELIEDQIKQKKDRDETISIVIKEPEHHIDVSLQAQGDLYDNQIKSKNDTDETSSIIIKEAEHRYMEKMSLQTLGNLQKDQTKLKKDTNETNSIVMKEPEPRHIDVSLQAQGDLHEAQIKPKKDTAEIVLFEIKEESKDNYTEGVLEAQKLYSDEDNGEPVLMPEEPKDLRTEMPQFCDVGFAKGVVTKLSSTCDWEIPINTEDNMRLNLETVDLSHNLDTVDLTPEEQSIELKEDPREVEGVSIDVHEELYNLETVHLSQKPEELMELKEEPMELGGVNLDAQKELYNLDTVELTPEKLSELKLEPKEEGVSFDAQELYVDHEVMDGVVLGPVVLERPDVYIKQEVPVENESESHSWEIPIHYELKEEPHHRGYIDVMNLELQAGLYVEHDVRHEVSGPGRLQSVGFYTEQAHSGPGRPCSVRLERIHVDTKQRTCRVGHNTYRLRGVAAYRKKRFSFDLSQARQAIQDKLKVNKIVTHNSQIRPPKKVTVADFNPKKYYTNTESENVMIVTSAQWEQPKKVVESKKRNNITEAQNQPSKNIIVVGSGPKKPANLGFRSVSVPKTKRSYYFNCKMCSERFKTKLGLIKHKSQVHFVTQLLRKHETTTVLRPTVLEDPQKTDRNEII